MNLEDVIVGIANITLRKNFWDVHVAMFKSDIPPDQIEEDQSHKLDGYEK